MPFLDIVVLVACFLRTYQLSTTFFFFEIFFTNYRRSSSSWLHFFSPCSILIWGADTQALSVIETCTVLLPRIIGVDNV